MIFSNKNKNNKSPQSKRSKCLSLILQFVPLYVLWLLLSQHYQPFYLVSGALLCGIVVAFNREMFTSFMPAAQDGSLTFKSALRTAGQFLKYLPWLLYQVIHDNLLVAYLVVHPRMPIDPRLLGFKTNYNRSVSQVILANSITLSPGTMTVLAEDNHYIIHALIPSSCEGLINAETQTRVAKIYDETAEQLPEAECGYTFGEIA